MPDEPEAIRDSTLQTCPACGVSFDRDVPECPVCDQRAAVSRLRTLMTVVIAITVVLTLAFLAALWTGMVIPISPDF